MHIAEIGTVAKFLPLLMQRLINSSFKAILQIVAHFSKKKGGKESLILEFFVILQKIVDYRQHLIVKIVRTK